MRSLARDRSSSRRAPPIAASKLPAERPSSSAFVFSKPQQRCVPTLYGCVPSPIACSFSSAPPWPCFLFVGGGGGGGRPPPLASRVDKNLYLFAELVGRVDV